MTTTRIPAARLRHMVKGSLRAHEDLVSACLQYLALLGVPAVPIVTGPRVAPRAGGGFDLRANAAQRGMTDIVACLPPTGRMCLIEAKSGKARRSPAQVRLHQRFSAAGATCLVIRNVLDLAPHVAARRSSPGGRP